MNQLPAAALDQLFREARTFTDWLDTPVADDTLHRMWDLMKLAPTSANSNPARFLFVRSKQGKERLRATLSAGNVDKTMAAPVTAIVAYDLRFYDKLPRLFPHNTRMHDLFAANPQLVETTAKRNSSLQGGYMIMAARAVGLDCGPMSGFDKAKVDEAFFSAGRDCAGCDQEFFPEGHVRSNFLCNLGYGDRSRLHPRSPRPSFEEACQII
jgi:3-hydroxypropanoate dehydrogenase